MTNHKSIEERFREKAGTSKEFHEKVENLFKSPRIIVQVKTNQPIKSHISEKQPENNKSILSKQMQLLLNHSRNLLRRMGLYSK